MTIAEINRIQAKIKELDDKNFNLSKEVSYLNDLASERESEFNASLKRLQSIEKGKALIVHIIYRWN